MSETIIKSRARVKATGEVLTPAHMVNQMLDLIPTEFYASPLSTWLEPACGTGNILVQILKRKLSHGSGKTHALQCVSSLYGVDIANDNVHRVPSRPRAPGGPCGGHRRRLPAPGQ